LIHEDKFSKYSPEPIPKLVFKDSIFEYPTK